MKKIFIITGGPGSGKTTLVNALKEKGFDSGKELSREFIKEQISSNGNALPWINRLKYSEELLRRRIKQFEELPDNICFLDRGIPDLIAYIIKDGFKVPDVFYEAAKNYRYEKIVFLTPPWKEIYKNDNERKESFDESVIIFAIIKLFYEEQGYQTIILPKSSVEERAKFILSFVNN